MAVPSPQLTAQATRHRSNIPWISPAPVSNLPELVHLTAEAEQSRIFASHHRCCGRADEVVWWPRVVPHGVSCSGYHSLVVTGRNVRYSTSCLKSFGAVMISLQHRDIYARYDFTTSDDRRQREDKNPSTRAHDKPRPGRPTKTTCNVVDGNSRPSKQVERTSPWMESLAMR